MELATLPIDPVVIILVLLAGQFQKHYLEDMFPSRTQAFKTLVTSFVFVLIYGLLFWVSGDFTKDLPLKWFLSYTVATSLYELLLKKYLDKYFPDNVVKIITLLLVSCSLMGCSVTKRKVHRKENLTERNYQVKRDSAHIINLVSSEQETRDSGALKLYLQTIQSSLDIVFDTSDHTVYSTAITAEKKDGKMVVNTGGRKLSGARFNDLLETQTKDSIHGSISKQADHAWRDSFRHAIDSAMVEIKSISSERTSVVNTRITVISLCILIILFALVLYLKRYTHIL